MFEIFYVQTEDLFTKTARLSQACVLYIRHQKLPRFLRNNGIQADNRP